ncbi:MAG: hypothetical protein OXF06_09720 [Bacteroidetes bacterium]|nr:hypothetical protein [Bacteroidota bacterium]
MAESYQDRIGRICDKARRIYDETLREKLELTHMGQSVVIDVDTGNYYLGETDDRAMKNAREQQPYGLYCIIDIGRVTRIRQ